MTFFNSDFLFPVLQGGFLSIWDREGVSVPEAQEQSFRRLAGKFLHIRTEEECDDYTSRCQIRLSGSFEMKIM